MKSDETHEMSRRQTPMLTVAETRSQPETPTSRPFTRDLCYETGETAVKHRLNGLRLCEECRRDLWAMPPPTLFPGNLSPESALRAWRNVCADMCGPEFLSSILRFAPMTPSYMCRIYQAQLGFLLHLQKTSTLASGSLETFWLLLWVKALSGKNNGHDQETAPTD